MPRSEGHLTGRLSRLVVKDPLLCMCLWETLMFIYRGKNHTLAYNWENSFNMQFWGFYREFCHYHWTFFTLTLPFVKMLLLTVSGKLWPKYQKPVKMSHSSYAYTHTHTHRLTGCVCHQLHRKCQIESGEQDIKCFQISGQHALCPEDSGLCKDGTLLPSDYMISVKWHAGSLSEKISFIDVSCSLLPLTLWAHYDWGLNTDNRAGLTSTV